MTAWYALKHSSGELISKNGAVLIHDNLREMEWFIPSCPPIGLRGSSPDEVSHHLGRPVMRLKDHPDLVALGLSWPLNKRDFW